MLKFGTKSKRGTMVLATAAVASLAQIGFGATAGWVGNTDVSWLTGTNWTGGSGAGGAAAATDVLLFGVAGSAGTTLANNFPADTSFGGLTFGPSAGAFTIGGNRILLTGDITDNATNVQTLNFGLAFDNATSSINVAAGGALSLGALTLGPANQAANVSTMNINNSVTHSSLLVQTNNATADTINIAAGATLASTGSVQIGAFATSATTINTRLDVTGAGSWVVNSASNFNVQTSSGSNNFGVGTTILDMSGLNNFQFNSATGSFGVGYLVTRPNATVRLAQNSTITAPLLGIGNSGVGNGADNASVGGQLVLGTGNTTLHVNTINIGFAKATGSISFQDVSLGSLTITGQAGSASTADIFIGRATTATYGGNGQNSVLLAGHQANVQAGTVVVGALAGGTAGTIQSTLTFDTGVFNVNSLQLAVSSSGTAPNGAAGSFIMGGSTAGSSATGVLNVANQFFLANRTNAGGGSANGTFIINGGTANVNCDITDASTTGTRNTTLTLDGGTLNMTGHNIGSDTSPITTINLNSGTLASAGRISGTTINIGSAVNLSSGSTYVVAPGGNLNSSQPLLTVASGGGVAGGSTGSQASINGDVSAASGSTVSPGLGTAAGTLRFNNNLSLNGGATARFKLSGDAGSGNDRVSVGGNLAAAGAVNIELGSVGSGPQVGNTYTLFDFGGSLTGNETSFNVIGFGSRQTFTIVPTSTTPGQVNLSVSGTPSMQLTWIGNAGNTWDLQGASNWRDPSLASQKFFNIDTVTFDDNSSNLNDVSLVGQLVPGSVAVNADRNYKFVGSGGISGGTGLTKSGNGSLIVATNNSYTGQTDIQSGTLQLGDGGTSGTLGSGTVNVNSTLVLNRGGAYTFANPITGGGVIRKVGSGTVTLPANNTFGGQTLIDAGAIRVASFGALGTGNATISAGAQLDIGGISAENVANGFGSKQFFIAGAGPDGSGALVNKGGPQQFNAFQQVILTADATIGGTDAGAGATGRLDIRNNTPQLDLAGFTLTKVSSNQFDLVGANVTDGNIVVNNGVLGIEAGSTINDNASGKSITYNAGSGVTTTAWFFNLTGTVTRPMFFNSGGGTIIIGNASPQNSTVGSNMTLNGPVTITSLNAGLGSLILNGNLVEGGTASSVTKTGPVSLVLGGASNTYAGNTTVSAGTLVLSNGGTSNSIPNSPLVRIAAGAALDVNGLSGGGITLSSAASQVLVSNGTTSGNVTAPANTSVRGSGTYVSTVTVSGGNISPGDSSVATLTATNLTLDSSTITSEIGAGTADLIVVPSSFNVSGINTFSLVNAGGATAGTYMLLDYTGSPLSDLSNFTFTPPAGFTLTPVNNTGNTSIDVTLTAIGATSAAWNNPGSGNWSVGGNWNPSTPPDGIDAVATFGSAISSAATVTLDGARTVGTINFANANSYTLAGSTLTLDVGSGAAAINVTAGSHTISAPITLNDNLTITSAASTGVNLSGSLAAIGKTITKAGAGSVQLANVRAGALNVTGGSAKVSQKGTANSSAGTSVVQSLSITAGASFDLTNNSMIIDYSGPVGTQLTDVRGHLRNGRMITSSGTTTTRLGYGDNAVLGKTSFAGQGVDSSSILVKYTYAGDADLDGDADGVDIGTWATNFTGELGGAGTQVWTQGDWDYDGDVDGVDAGLWAQAFTGELGGGGLGNLVVNDPNIAPGVAAILRGMGITVVPEPASLGILAGLGAIAMNRRRSRCK